MPPPPPPAASTPPAADSRWFAEQVHRHESSLKAYLFSAFPALRDVEDVMQESYLRVWHAGAVRPIHSARAFLFRVARNLALDLVRRERTSPLVAVRDLAALPVAAAGRDAVATAELRDKIDLLAAALVELPPVCRSVVMLRKLHHLSRGETAKRLGIAEKTVDEHLARGMRRLAARLRARGVAGFHDA